MQTGKLIIVPTPIGNMSDITLRALESLKNADIIACEDTRRTGRLLKHFEIPGKKLAGFHEHNEISAAEKLLNEITVDNKTVALCTDGGTPSISDPGYRLVTAARDRNIEVESLPGSCAAIVALVSSGLAVASFTFKGFPPRKPGKLRRYLEEELESRHSLIFYESPYRIGKFLKAAYEVFGERKAAVCREMTKLHEEVKIAELTELSEFYLNNKTKGEITIVIEGKSKE
ncbi:MAG: 16S rRNA (cytidine(1402)-2'-O)-methyltransferase [Planctomycetota bacterium]|jgi:16S rRNA (cytidine1402-2'-O)-methyltransferase